jgi:hypothetical protein
VSGGAKRRFFLGDLIVPCPSEWHDKCHFERSEKSNAKHCPERSEGSLHNAIRSFALLRMTCSASQISPCGRDDMLSPRQDLDAIQSVGIPACAGMTLQGLYPSFPPRIKCGIYCGGNPGLYAFAI